MICQMSWINWLEIDRIIEADLEKRKSHDATPSREKTSQRGQVSRRILQGVAWNLQVTGMSVTKKKDLFYFIFKSRIQVEDVNMMLNMVDVQVSEVLSGVVMWTRKNGNDGLTEMIPATATGKEKRKERIDRDVDIDVYSSAEA